MRYHFLFLLLHLSAYPFTIVIDPGHGGKHLGGIGADKSCEKELTLIISQQLDAQLKLGDNTVYLTRTKDTHFHENREKDLYLRASRSAHYNADLFISIHANTGGKYARGFEIYVPYTRESKMESYTVAAYIHHELSHTLPAKWGGKLGNLNEHDGGIRAARFHVLRGHACPALVIELDYISNAECLKKLRDPAYQKKLVRGIADGIEKYKKIRSDQIISASA